MIGDQTELKNRIQKWIKNGKLAWRGECLEWQGPTTHNGYGKTDVQLSITYYRAHRIAYIAENGHVTSDVEICHTCDNRLCCNSKHLFAGTKQQNMNDMVRKNRQAQGEDHGRSRMTKAHVISARRLHEEGATEEDLADIFGIELRAMRNILRRKTWAHL